MIVWKRGFGLGGCVFGIEQRRGWIGGGGVRGSWIRGRWRLRDGQCLPCRQTVAHVVGAYLRGRVLIVAIFDGSQRVPPLVESIVHGYRQDHARKREVLG